MGDFQERVLCLISRIPKGKITTYKIVAHALGTRAYRAVGNALNKNKTPVVIPCHRIVDSDGSLGGYALGEEKKLALLRQEGIRVEKQKERFYIKDFKDVLFEFGKR